MPELVMEKSNPTSKSVQSGPYVPHKEHLAHMSPRSPLSTQSHESESTDLGVDTAAENSMDQLYHNVYEMQNSDHPSSKFSYGYESRVDSELRYLAGGDFVKAESIKKEATPMPNEKESSDRNVTPPRFKNTNQSSSAKSSPSKKIPRPNTRSRSSHERPPSGKRTGSKSNSKKNEKNSRDESEDPGYLGPYLLKQARELVASGDNPKKALELASRAMRSFESCEFERPNLDFVMCLHIVAALYCILGQYREAIPVLERSIEIPKVNEDQNQSLAKFSGCMQLGDTYAMLGQIENSLLCYKAGLEIQKSVLGKNDARFGETCRYVSEAHVQAMQFEEAKKLCQTALNIHRNSGISGSLEEAADRRLMGLICDSNGDYETALEHYVWAGMAMAAGGHDSDVAAVDVCIGDAYLSLARYDEAVFAYQKALNVFKSTKGDNHPSAASVYVRLADLYNKIGKFSESKSYCENALRIYMKPIPGNPNEEIAIGLIEVSAIYESMNELDQSLNLLKKALEAYGKVPGQQCSVAGIEAQIGVLCYMMSSYSESYDYFKASISKFREAGDKKYAVFGIVLNQMGLACVQVDSLDEAADVFEEARDVLEAECGPHHPDTLGVYSNLAGTYDAVGRTENAIEILEYVVGMREEKLGTANPDVDDEKKRLARLLREAGRDRSKKNLSLEFLLAG